MKVWIALYTHRHGTDTWVSANEELAYEHACDVISDNLNEVDDEERRAKIKNLIESKQYVDAFNAWHEYQNTLMHHEEIELRVRAVQGLGDEDGQEQHESG